MVKIMKVVFIIFFLGLVLCAYSDGNLLCSDEFCKSYLEKEKCNEVPEPCKIQNFTHNGVELPYAGPCNCCDYCLANLNEGVTCGIGDPTSPPPRTICGNGLSCKLVNNKPICRKMTNTICAQAQIAYDIKRETGKLGQLEQKPECDRNGMYKPFVCVPGEICYCVSENGERIFGEIPFTVNPEYFLRCKCSRNYHEGVEIRNRNLHPGEHLRCQSNGDYDTLQCVGDQCLCVDAEDGHPTHPELNYVNMTLISASTLPCYNNETHMEAEYYRNCEGLYIEQLNLVREYEAEGIEVVGHTFPNCQLDGYYALVQETSGTKYCSDPYGNKLENYEVDKSNPLALTMNCKCAWARNIMTEVEKPECLANGNYNEIQCRRGMCRCVDENGAQIKKEVDYQEKDKLFCDRQPRA